MTEDREAVLDCVSPGGKPAPDVSGIDDYHDHDHHDHHEHDHHEHDHHEHDGDHHEHDGDKDQNSRFSKMH